MTNPEDSLTDVGAARVEEAEHLAAGLSVPENPAMAGTALEDRTDEPLPQTKLADLTLSMFTQGASTRVRVGNPHNSSELYEFAYASADEANTAMLDGGILSRDQVADMSQPAGTNIALANITVEQLEAAGLKRHGASTI